MPDNQTADTAPEGASNDRPLDATMAQTGPGIPDEALGPDEALPGDKTGDTPPPDPDAVFRHRSA
jgi:hypothetical protein